MNNQSNIILRTIFMIAVGAGVLFFVLKMDQSLSISPSIESTVQNNTVILNDTSKNYAIMGSQSWSSFECSVWASAMNEDEEAERLFTYGYEQGQLFLTALMADKIDSDHMSSEVPVGVTWSLHGPSEEFILGRIYSNAEGNALEEVYKTGEHYNSVDMQQVIASNKYRDGNCKLIGK